MGVIARVLFRIAGKRLQIGTGAERLGTLPGDDDDGNILPADRFDRHADLLERVVVDGIAALLARDHDRGDAIGDIEQDRFLGHRGYSL